MARRADHRIGVREFIDASCLARLEHQVGQRVIIAGAAGIRCAIAERDGGEAIGRQFRRHVALLVGHATLHPDLQVRKRNLLARVVLQDNPFFEYWPVRGRREPMLHVESQELAANHKRPALSRYGGIIEAIRCDGGWPFASGRVIEAWPIGNRHAENTVVEPRMDDAIVTRDRQPIGAGGYPRRRQFCKFSITA